MVSSPSAPKRHIQITLCGTVLYTLLSAYYSYAVTGKVLVFAFFCMPPYLLPAWILIFTAPACARAAFAFASIAILAFFGTLITTSSDPKIGQAWWFHLVSVPLAALGAGLAANYLTPWLRLKSELLAPLVATFAAGSLPYAFLITFA